MIGARISARRPRPLAAIVVLAIGGAVAALGILAHVAALVPLAAAPGAVGAALLVVGERGFRARFTPVAMEIARPPQTIPYNSLFEVRPLGVSAGHSRPDSFAIQVVHARGGFVIPARLTHSSERVYTFLRGFVADRKTPLPSALEAYRAEQAAQFGAEKVWAYVGRHGGDLVQVRNLRAIGVGLLAVAAVWAAIPFRRTDEPLWWPLATVAAVIGGILLAVDSNIRGRETSGRTSAPGTAALVISPVGVAVQQAQLTGHLTWQEIKKVTVRATRGSWAFSGSQNMPGIVLEVEGAAIVLTDSYDRPLSEIHDRILRYWR